MRVRCTRSILGLSYDASLGNKVFATLWQYFWYLSSIERYKYIKRERKNRFVLLITNRRIASTL
jgi:hypothetical protein